MPTMLRPNQLPWALKESGLVVAISAEGKEIYNLPRMSTDGHGNAEHISLVQCSSVKFSGQK